MDTIAFTQLADLRRLRRRDAGTDTVFDIGELQPTMQTHLGDPEILRVLRQRRLAL